MRDTVHQGKSRSLRNFLFVTFCWLLFLLALANLAGCTRQFFRHSADTEVNAVLDEKNRCMPGEARIEQYHAYPDPLARFANPANPDRPPMPPDDPLASQLAPQPQHPHHVGIAWIEGTGYLTLLEEWDAVNRARVAARGQKETAQDHGYNEFANSAACGLAFANAKPQAAGTGDIGLPKEASGVQLTAIFEPQGPTAGLQPPQGSQLAEGSVSGPSGLPAPGGQKEERLPSPENVGGAPVEPRPLPEVVGGAAVGPGCPRQQPYLITMDQAVVLGIINSREYQNRREDLYLAALPVTLQRFSFAAQAFLTEDIIRQWAGPENPQGPANRWAFNTNTGFTKLFSTGALLVLRFANQTVINLGGSAVPRTVSTSTINLDLVQPFLKGGGRAVTLEPLTQTERNLVYEIRSYARFRPEFYISIAGGANLTLASGVLAGSGVSTSAGTLAAANGASGGGAGTGIPTAPSVTANLGSSGAATGLAPGILPGVLAPQVTPGGAGRLFLSIGLGAPTPGYLPTLLIVAQLENDRKNVLALEKNLRTFQAFEEGNQIDKTRVDQVRLQLLSGRSAVLQDVQNVNSALDQLRLQLGLPADLPLELDQTPIQPITDHLLRYEETFARSEDVIDRSQKAADPDDPSTYRRRLRALLVSHPLLEKTRFRQEIGNRLATWEKATNQELDDFVRPRLKELADLARPIQNLLLEQAKAEGMGQKWPAAQQTQLETLRQRQIQLDVALSVPMYEQALRDFEKAPWQAKGLTPSQRDIVFSGIKPLVLNLFTKLMFQQGRGELLEQLSANWPRLPPAIVDGVDLLQGEQETAEQTASRAALRDRLDLMNARAQVVDAWRQVAIFANALLGVFNAQYHLDSVTPAGANRPLAFSTSRTNSELLLNTELPLVRKAERNAYRTALIAYERARRALMANEDFTVAAIRNEVRQLRLLANNYKIQQVNVQLAFPQRESSEQELFGPPNPNQGQLSGSALAALTQQLLTAQNTLKSAENNVYAIWTNYLVTRMQLYHDIERMPLDSRGVWIDELSDDQPPATPGRELPPGAPGAGGEQPASAALPSPVTLRPPE